MDELLNFELPFIDDSTFDMTSLLDYETADVQLPKTMMNSMDGADVHIVESEETTNSATFMASSDTSSVQKTEYFENKSVDSPSASSSQSGEVARSQDSSCSEPSFHDKDPHAFASTIVVHGAWSAPTITPTLNAIRGGSKKRKTPNVVLEDISDDEERKILARKLRNKASAQTSRDRQKNRMAQLECNLQLMQSNMAIVQQQLTQEQAKNFVLGERMRQYELLLRIHKIDTSVLSESNRTPKGPNIPSNATNQTSMLTNNIVPSKGAVATNGVMVFAMLFAFTFSFNGSSSGFESACEVFRQIRRDTIGTPPLHTYSTSRRLFHLEEPPTSNHDDQFHAVGDVHG
uniref:BZIP domain-containing protein n=1 Tax=Eutreptiella gymnastica TaxID=73025 RepID=A0A7S1N4J4_9EUGL|mmetsp:Transcript_118386/g.205990  ORF Transcript_118386/g.205990 Transcript_118386/m.205990 type:complete len:346 (+) Transcript_118386:833-1870(+)